MKISSLLFLLFLTSCAVFRPSQEEKDERRQRRDIRLLTKIKARSSELFTKTTDTVTTYIPFDTVIYLERDSIAFRELLEKYKQVQEDKRTLAEINSLTENALAAKNLLYQKERAIVDKLMKGAYTNTPQFAQDSAGNIFNVSFEDGKVRILGKVPQKTINNNETSPLLVTEKLNFFQTVRKYWHYFILSAFVGFILTLIMVLILKK